MMGAGGFLCAQDETATTVTTIPRPINAIAVSRFIRGSFLQSAEQLARAFRELLVAAHFLGVLPRFCLSRQIEVRHGRVEQRRGDHAAAGAQLLLALRDELRLPFRR